MGCLLLILLAAPWGCQTLPIEKKAIVVETPEQLMEAIGPDREIHLKGGPYVLSGLSQRTLTHGVWEAVHDGDQLIIRGVSNLKMKGLGKEPVRILVRPRYAYVLTFKNCRALSLENIEFGHTPKKGYCTGGVLAFEKSSTLSIRNCILSGSGSEGLTLKEVDGLTFQKSSIQGCTYGIMTVDQSSRLMFTDSQFGHNKGFDLISVNHSDDIRFTNCEIHDNWTGRSHGSDYALFSIGSSSEVTLEKCRIRHNEAPYFLRREGMLMMKDCRLERNAFSQDGYRLRKKKNC
jgi:hypothetical protein